MSRDWKSRSSFMASFWPLYAAEWMAVNPRCVCVCVYVGGGGGEGGRVTCTIGLVTYNTITFKAQLQSCTVLF